MNSMSRGMLTARIRSAKNTTEPFSTHTNSGRSSFWYIAVISRPISFTLCAICSLVRSMRDMSLSIFASLMVFIKDFRF